MHDERVPDASQDVIRESESSLLEEAVENLPDRSRYVLIWRYGLDHRDKAWAILGKWFRPPWVVAGSILPDVPSFAAFFYLLAAEGLPDGSGEGFFGFVMANGNPNRQPGFMEVSFLLNALPLYLLVGAIVLLRRRSWLLALWAGWGLHAVEDFLTHVIDAYAPLYPFFPEWRLRGAVSY